MTRKYDGSRPVGSDGLLQKERDVLSLADQGLKPDEIIAARPDLRPAFIRDTVNRCSYSGRERWSEEARLGSADLLKALRRHHPDRCGVPS
ncbi:hypothetical protein [Sphingopyxis sp. GW247-27LB]|uniref:hypothetical protein n=1 Tax=Sphingopyxis sp. GW247-27LB TaxID=2012632 RepID=UPI001140E916|nr:hypothetical protein [Sphingopyxis sp. GW247-27LB]